jgi:hypothetical protein
MNKILAYSLTILAAIVLFGGLVYAVLVAAKVTEPAAMTVHGPTTKRLWATSCAALGLVGVVAGGRAVRRAAQPGGAGRNAALVAGAAGLLATCGGMLNLAVAKGGPGSGNGVVGGAAAVVLGVTAVILGRLAWTRFCRGNALPSRRTPTSGQPQTGQEPTRIAPLPKRLSGERTVILQNSKKGD